MQNREPKLLEGARDYRANLLGLKSSRVLLELQRSIALRLAAAKPFVDKLSSTPAADVQRVRQLELNIAKHAHFNQAVQSGLYEMLLDPEIDTRVLELEDKEPAPTPHPMTMTAPAPAPASDADVFWGTPKKTTKKTTKKRQKKRQKNDKKTTASDADDFWS